MKCPKCAGKGFMEYEAGLIMVECADCQGTGEVDDNSDSGTGRDNQPTTKASKPKRRKRKARKV